MSQHEQTIGTIIGSAVGLTVLGGVAVKVILKPVRRVADAYEAFVGTPEMAGREAVPGVMAVQARHTKRLGDIEAGNLEILRVQRAQGEDIQKVVTSVATITGQLAHPPRRSGHAT